MKSARLGFTLLELMIVVVIMGIIAATIVPRLNSDQGFKVQLLSQQILSTLNYARARAIATGCAVRVVWNTSTNIPDLYQYIPCNSNASPPQLIYTTAEGRSLSEGGLPNNFVAGTYPDTFYFNSLGEPYLESDPETRYYGTWTILEVSGKDGYSTFSLVLFLNPLGYQYTVVSEDNS